MPPRQEPTTPAFIYAIEVTIDPHERKRAVLYVGYTTRPEKRRKEHLGTICQRERPLLWRHILKWRTEGLFPRFVVLEECTLATAARQELVWIARYLDAGHQLANHGPWNLKDPLYTGGITR